MEEDAQLFLPRSGGIERRVILKNRFLESTAWGDGMLQRLAEGIVGRTDLFNTVVLLDYVGPESIPLVTLHHIPERYRGSSPFRDRTESGDGRPREAERKAREESGPRRGGNGF